MDHTFYELSGKIALAGWALIFASLFIRQIRSWAWPAAQFVIPAILCVMYLIMVWQGRHALILPDSFTDHDALGRLYDDGSALTAGWLHFLAFDMFAGAWMVRDGSARRIPVLLILLCLPFTFLFGPSGLLLYIIVRFATGQRRPAGADDGAVTHREG